MSDSKMTNAEAKAIYVAALVLALSFTSLILGLVGVDLKGFLISIGSGGFCFMTSVALFTFLYALSNVLKELNKDD